MEKILSLCKWGLIIQVFKACCVAEVLVTQQPYQQCKLNKTNAMRWRRCHESTHPGVLHFLVKQSCTSGMFSGQHCCVGLWSCACTCL